MEPTYSFRVLVRGYGVRGFAGRLNRAPAAVSMILSGKRQLPPHWCEEIERKFGVRAEDLRPDLGWVRDSAGRLYWRIPQ